MHRAPVPLRRAIFTGAPRGAIPPGPGTDTLRPLLSLTPRRPLWWSVQGVSTNVADSDPAKRFPHRGPPGRLFAGQGTFDDLVADATDGRDGDRDLVARTQIFGRVSGVADAFWGTGQQYVAGQQGHG